MTSLPQFKLEIKSPHHTWFEGQVTSVTAANQMGEFDVLAKHTRTVSRIAGLVVVKNADQIIYQTQLDDALLWVSTESVKILILPH